VGILGQRGGWHVVALQKTLKERGINAPQLPITWLTGRIGGRPWLSASDESLDTYDVLFVRTIPGGSLEQVIFRVDALHHLENNGVRIVNSPATIERTVDKYYTSALLEAAGLPTPRVVVTERFDVAMNAFEELGGDVIVKPLFGSEGRGVTRISDGDTAYRVFRAWELGRYVYYVQQFIPHFCQDIRVFVIGGKAVAGMERRGQTWKTNVAQGARTYPLELDSTLQDLSVRAAGVLDADYAGVDILRTEDGHYTLLEVNGIPGWRGLESATGIDIARLVVDFILEGKV
jgi:RimK family alpha-L-glutamate ligase